MLRSQYLWCLGINGCEGDGILGRCAWCEVDVVSLMRRGPCRLNCLHICRKGGVSEDAGKSGL